MRAVVGVLVTNRLKRTELGEQPEAHPRHRERRQQALVQIPLAAVIAINGRPGCVGVGRRRGDVTRPARSSRSQTILRAGSVHVGSRVPSTFRSVLAPHVGWRPRTSMSAATIAFDVAWGHARGGIDPPARLGQRPHSDRSP